MSQFHSSLCKPSAEHWGCPGAVPYYDNVKTQLKGDGKDKWFCLSSPMAAPVTQVSLGEPLPKHEGRGFPKCYSPLKSQQAMCFTGEC